MAVKKIVLVGGMLSKIDEPDYQRLFFPTNTDALCVAEGFSDAILLDLRICMHFFFETSGKSSGIYDFGRDSLKVFRSEALLWEDVTNVMQSMMNL